MLAKNVLIAKRSDCFIALQLALIVKQVSKACRITVYNGGAETAPLLKKFTGIVTLS